MHVESQNATSGAIRVVITSNNGRSIANIYMNITGVYQEDSVFVRKGMKAYICPHLTAYTMEYVIEFFLKNSSITIVTEVVELFFTIKYVPSPTVHVISVSSPVMFIFEMRYLADVPEPYPFII